MKMITPMIDPRHFDPKVRRIRIRVSAILRKWGLLPRFKRWRLTQDPGTGMMVLFGILNNKYIATHTSIPFSDYFDPRLLHDLANDLQMEVVSCNSDGLRYAFILERGSLLKLPTHIEYPFLEGDRLSVRVVYANQPVPELTNPQVKPVPSFIVESVEDRAQVNQDIAAFLKVLDDIKLKAEVASKLSAQGLPDVITIDEQEFKKRVAEHKVIWQKSHPP
jgi:hypothetical protein